MNEIKYRICSRCVMDTTARDIAFDYNGLCNFCRDFNEKHKKEQSLDEKDELEKLVTKIKKDGKGREYDCIMGVSGGIDSSYGLYLAKNQGLRILAVHMDNGWDSELSVNNISNLVRGLGIDLYTHVIDWDEYRDLMESFFKANVIDIELLTDNAILAVNYQQANNHGIRYILAGSNAATEGMRMPAGWNWFKLDKKNIKCIQGIEGKKKIKTMPLIGIRDRLYYEMIKGIKWISFLDYYDYNKSNAIDFLKKEYGFKPYPYKHYESVFTRFYQGHILPRKFGVDKRRQHLSNLICSAQMSREEALRILDNSPYPSAEELDNDINYFLKKMDWTREKLDRYLSTPAEAHLKYGSEKWVFELLRKTKSFFGAIHA